MKLVHSKHRVLLGVAALLLALFLIRPGSTRLRTVIATSISAALGRPVDIDAVHARVLPQPGFDLENFIVRDDPSFSAEPVLRSSEVTATLRLSSLLRGRLEISRLSLTAPSFNLVRNNEGHWNVENLLERTAKVAVAPTSKTRTEPRPGFPYIEADRARINFKFGQEKTPYALMDADIAFWQDSENAWGVRLRARPVRTDFNLSDTGFLKIDGTWQRAARLRDTPLQFSLVWDRPQLGQMTKLISGKDKGWRGAVTASAVLEGKPSDLSIRTEASLQDFRRYDIMGGRELLLTAHCEAHYSSADRTFRRILCDAPVGEGAVMLRGEIAGLVAPHNYDLVLSAEQVPIQGVVELARHAKKDLPEDLLASGNLDAKFTMRASGAAKRTLELSGSGETSDFGLQSAATKSQLELGSVPFSISSPDNAKSDRENAAKAGNRRSEQPPDETHLGFGPFTIALGRRSPATVRGWVTKSGYSLFVQGDAQLKRLLQLARTLGLPASQPAADGLAKLDLRIAGEWSGFAAPDITGTAQLNAVRAELNGLNAPLEITSASLTLAEDAVRLQNLVTSMAGTQWTGSLLLPRHCTSVETCTFEFDLHVDQLVTNELNELLNPHPRKRAWYRLLSPTTQPDDPSILAVLQAAGKLTANRLVLQNLVGEHVSASLELQAGKLRISDLRAEVLGGKHSGEWQADFTVKPPAYSGNGILERVSLAQLAEVMGDGWITGTATARYRLTTSGYSAADLLASADGTLQLEMHDGILAHILLSSSATLHVSHFKGRVALRDGQFEIQEGKLEAPSGIYHVSGTASLGHKLDIRLLHDASHGFSITGTLAEPRVSAVTRPETQAALKP